MRRSFYQGPGPTRFWWEHEHQPLAPAKRGAAGRGQHRSENADVLS